MKFCKKKFLNSGRNNIATSNRFFPIANINSLEKRKEQKAPKKTVVATILYDQKSYHVKTNVNQKLLGFEGTSQNIQSNNLQSAVVTWSQFYESKSGALNFEFSKNKKGELSTKLWYSDLPQNKELLNDPTKYLEG